MTAHAQEQPPDDASTTSATGAQDEPSNAAPTPVGPPPDCTITTEVALGSTGPDALCVELALVALGYELVGPDEEFDTSGVEALKLFQAANGLVADGIAGPLTAELLEIPPPPTAPPHRRPRPRRPPRPRHRPRPRSRRRPRHRPRPARRRPRRLRRPPRPRRPPRHRRHPHG